MINLYRRAIYLSKTAIISYFLTTDGVNIYYFDKSAQAVVAFKKENGYTPTVLDWYPQFVGCRGLCVRYMGGYMYTIMNKSEIQGAVLDLYKNEKQLVSVIIERGRLVKMSIFGRDGYYTNLVYIRIIDDYIDEYYIEDDEFKIKRCVVLKRQTINNYISLIETTERTYVFDHADNGAIYTGSINDILQFIRENDVIPKFVSLDARYITFSGTPDAKYDIIFYDLINLRPIMMGKGTGYAIGTINGFIYGPSSFSSLTKYIHLYRNGIKYITQIANCSASYSMGYIATYDGMSNTVCNAKFILYDTRWLWRDFALQDKGVQKLAITTALVLKRMYGADRRIIYKIVRMVMEE